MIVNDGSFHWNSDVPRKTGPEFIASFGYERYVLDFSLYRLYISVDVDGEVNVNKFAKGYIPEGP